MTIRNLKIFYVAIVLCLLLTTAIGAGIGIANQNMLMSTVCTFMTLILSPTIYSEYAELKQQIGKNNG